jgi:hypothetical protein
MEWPMPHDRAALDGFFAELRRVWTMAGPPSYEDFKKLSTKVKGPAQAGGPWVDVLSRSTTQDILAGRRHHPPKWQWVARFLTVLRAAAAEAGVDPDSLGTLAEWKKRHEAACAAVASMSQMARVAGGGHVQASGSTTSPEYGRARVPRQATGPVLDEEDAHPDTTLASLLRTVGREWWHDYRDLVPDWFGAYLSLEPAASLIRAYDTTLVPGLLQTEAYAEAAIRIASLTSDQAAVRPRVELRMRRQQLLNRPDAPKLWVIIDEAAVRRRFGSAKTMRGQITHLIEVSQQPNITVQVIPLDTSVHAVAGGPITFLRFARSHLPDVVYLEQLTGALYLPSQGDVSHYITVLGRLAIEALEPAATADFLREILLEM